LLEVKEKEKKLEKYILPTLCMDMANGMMDQDPKDFLHSSAPQRLVVPFWFVEKISIKETQIISSMFFLKTCIKCV